MKEKAWAEIALAVSAVCGDTRTADAVKKKWCSTMSDTKKKGAALKKELHRTGGGSSAVTPLSNTEQRIIGPIYTEGAGKINYITLQYYHSWAASKIHVIKIRIFITFLFCNL